MFARIHWETASDLPQLKLPPTINARVAGTKRSQLFSAQKRVFRAVTHGRVHNFVVHARISMKLSGIADTGALRILSIELSGDCRFQLDTHAKCVKQLGIGKRASLEISFEDFRRQILEASALLCQSDY